jgi:dihydrofolate reductase
VAEWSIAAVLKTAGPKGPVSSNLTVSAKGFMITLIAAIGRNREIGLDNKLVCSFPEDMKHFKSYTMGKVIIMGRKTFASIGNKPLPGRKCIIVSSHDMTHSAVTAKTVESALSIDHCYPELVVIGGESVYRQAMPFADKLVITHIDEEFKADSFFPEIDPAVWKINSVVDGGTVPFNYKFVEYIRNENSGVIKREAS